MKTVKRVYGKSTFYYYEGYCSGKPYEIVNMGYCNTVVEWSDVLSPVNYIWEEYASIQISEDCEVSGLWDINYHELRWEWLAKDYMKLDQERDFEYLGELDMGIDYAVTYLDDIHMQKVILRQGNKVLQGTFHEYSGEKEKYFTMEEWAAMMAESIK